MSDGTNDRRYAAEALKPAQRSLAAQLGFPEPIAGAQIVTMRRGPGRPRGSVSRRQEQLAAWLKDKYGDPLERLAAAAAMGPAELAQRLQCPLIEAAQFWRELQKDLLPYHHSEMPKRVDVGRAEPLRIPDAVFERRGDDAIDVTPEKAMPIDAPPLSDGKP